MNDEGRDAPSVGVDWRDWGEESFAEARERDVPVLLSLTATWCSACHEMDRETYAAPRVAAAIRDSYVPVRVDVDRHPRVRERYNMGGFPSTVFCTPDGKVLTGTTYLGPDGMKQVLDRMRETWVERGEAAGSVPRALAGDPTPAGEVTTAIEEHLAGQLEVQYDSDFGGWGREAKFPMPRTVEFAFKRARRQALSTLDVVERNLFDDVDGGFFRYATTRDWSDVEREKLLATNAALVRAYANGYLYTGDDTYRETAAATVDFLTDDLWTGQAVGGSLGPAEESDYYDLPAEERADAAPPRRDLTVYAGDNGLAAEAFLTLAAYTDDEDARDAAERILDHLDQALVDDGVVLRYRDGDETGERGLLAEHARVAAAFCRAEQVLERADEARRLFALVARYYNRALTDLREVDRLGMDRPVLADHVATARQLDRFARQSSRLAETVLDRQPESAIDAGNDLGSLADRGRAIVADATTAVLGDPDAEAAYAALTDREEVTGTVANLDRTASFDDADGDPLLRLALLDDVRRTADVGGTIARIGIRAAARRDDL